MSIGVYSSTIVQAAKKQRCVLNPSRIQSKGLHSLGLGLSDWLEFVLTDTMIDNTEMTAEQAHMELCEWLGYQLGSEELERLGRIDNDAYVERYAVQFYSDHTSDQGLLTLLDQMSGGGCHGATRQSVRRSAMRDTLRFVVGAHRQNPGMPLHEQLAAHQMARQQKPATMPASKPMFAVTFSG